jgi:hypothetical protein
VALGRPSRENKVKWDVTIRLTSISNDDRSDGTGLRIYSPLQCGAKGSDKKLFSHQFAPDLRGKFGESSFLDTDRLATSKDHLNA